MRRIVSVFPAEGATAEAATTLLEERPLLRAYLTGLSRSGRSRARTNLLGAGYPEDVGAVLLPRLDASYAPRVVGPWAQVPGQARIQVARALGLNASELPVTPASWTPETAGAAADAVAAHWTNATTVTNALTKLRAALTQIWAADGAKLPDDVRAATLRDGITRTHNARIEASRDQRASKGLEIPPEYRNVDDIRARVAAYLAAAENEPTAQVAADLHVVLSARPGEVNTLQIGDRGGVPRYTTGVLKKRGRDGDATYPIVSVLGPAVVRDFLAKWRASTPGSRSAAMGEMDALLGRWGMQRRGQLRHIGASLAQTSAILTGGATNDVTASDVRRAALRHNEPARRPATDFYGDVNDPTLVLAAQLSRLGADDLAAVHALIRGAQKGAPDEV